ncbi:hypothetical protein D3C76_1306340 [compost metagenome]
MDVGYAREITDQRFTQSVIQRIDRSIAFSGSINAVAVDVDFDEGFGNDRSASCFLNEHFEGFKDKQLLQLTISLTKQKLQ